MIEMQAGRVRSVQAWLAVTGLLGVAFIGSLIMPNPKRHGYLDGDGTVEEALTRKSRLSAA